MGAQKIYCEVDFLRNFFDQRPTTIVPTEENINLHRTWINVFEFIFKSEILFDNSEDFKKSAVENEYFKILWKSSIQSAEKLDFLDNNYPNLENFEESITSENCSLSSIYLTNSDDNICEKIHSEFGVMVLNLNFLYKNNFFQINNEGLNSQTTPQSIWDFFSSSSHICNSLCISDNYILSDTDRVDNNLLPILDKLLPLKLKIPFHISIFTLIQDGEERYYNYIEKYLNQKIKDIRPENFKFVLGIYSTSKNKRFFHDRAILTNYMIIESGAGFDFFSRDSKDSSRDYVNHQTKIESFYHHFTKNTSFYLNNKSISLFEFMSSSLKMRYKNEKKKVKDKSLIRENRLLE